MRIDANVRRRTDCRQSSPRQATLDANSINSGRSAINPVINVLAVRSLRRDVAADWRRARSLGLSPDSAVELVDVISMYGNGMQY